MSLINQMLRDLDARHAPAVDRVALPADVHVLLPEPTRSWLPLALLLAVAAAAAGYWMLRQDEPAPMQATVLPVRKPAPVPQPPAPAPAEPAPQIPAVAAIPAPPASPAAPATSAATAAAIAKAPGPVVKTISPPPTPAKTADLRPAAPKKPAAESGGPVREATGPIAREKTVATAARPPDRAPAPAPTAAAPTKEAVASSEPTSIDKRPRSGSASDGADNEYRRAMAALRRGAAPEAQEGLRATLRLDARHISARQALLSLLVDQQQWSDAQSLIEDGLALDPSQVGWAMALARLQLESGKLAEAAETLSRHARHAEHSADYLAFQALVLQKLKRPHEAADRYRAALALKPAESRWWYGLGTALEAEQKPQEARDAFLKARDTGNLPPELVNVVEQRLR